MSESEHGSRVGRLLENAKQGDADAREELFEYCRNYVNVIARSNVETWMRAKVDASDLVQQTLLEAHRCFQDFQGGTEGEWLGWLRQILTHNTHDFVRKYRAGKRDVKREVGLQRRAPDASGAIMELSASLQSPSEIFMHHEREFEVANAIAQLPEDYQEVIQLRNLQRLPFEEVASRMGRTRGAVQMLWMRALKRLQETLAGQEEE